MLGCGLACTKCGHTKRRILNEHDVCTAARTAGVRDSPSTKQGGTHLGAKICKEQESVVEKDAGRVEVPATVRGRAKRKGFYSKDSDLRFCMLADAVKAARVLRWGVHFFA